MWRRDNYATPGPRRGHLVSRAGNIAREVLGLLVRSLMVMTRRDPDPERRPDPIRLSPTPGQNASAPTAAVAGRLADDATLGLFAVMHELNNLLDGATRTLSLARHSLGGLALAPSLDPAIVRQLDTAGSALEHMAELLHDVMRPGAGTALEQRRSVALVEAITHAMDAHRPLAAAHRVDLSGEVSPRLVLTAAGAIYPVLANVVRNAIESIAESRIGGRVELIAELVPNEPAGFSVRIDVVDDGPGPDPAAIRHAFDPGFTTRAAGFGVGLSLARRIVREIGGEVTIAARSPNDPIRPGGRGAHVTIIYPHPA